MTVLPLGRLGAALLAIVFALGLVLSAPVAEPVRAATPDLTLVTDATYEVQPEERRVRVTLRVVATNHLRDTATRRYYFDRAFLAVLPGTTGYAISGGSGTPSVGVNRRTDDFTILQLSFGQRIYSGKSATFTLRFDLPDPGGAPTREVRVGDSLVSFPVWAFASDSTPGSTVAVVFPPGFSVTVEAGELPASTQDEQGRTIFRTARLDRPLDFFVYLVGDRQGSYAETERRAQVADTEAELLIRAWPDDPDWATRVGDLFEQGLPVLGELIGLPWDRDGPLTVQESVSRATGGYAGLFDPGSGQVEVAYYADSFVILHEAAHAWFNGALLADRWANEAFASWYAVEAAARLEEPVEVGELTEELEAARIPLNAWGAIGREAQTTEDYAYAATLTLARLIAERAGDDGLRRVWSAAADGLGAYQPNDGAAERGSGVPDWRVLLDLLEDQTASRYDDLWRDWVVRDDEADLLDARRTARDEHEALLERAGDWRLPGFVRAALRAWQFDQAADLLREANGVLNQRDRLETAARAAGLTLPGRLEEVFESDAGFAAAAREADLELQAIEIYAGAAATRIDEPDPVQALGLLGSQPDAALAAAREAFARGDLDDSVTAAASARTTWEAAPEVGRNRLLTIVGVGILLLIAAAFVVSRLRARRAPRPSPAAPEGPVPEADAGGPSGSPAAEGAAIRDPASSPTTSYGVPGPRRDAPPSAPQDP